MIIVVCYYVANHQNEAVSAKSQFVVMAKYVWSKKGPTFFKMKLLLLFSQKQEFKMARLELLLLLAIMFDLIGCYNRQKSSLVSLAHQGSFIPKQPFRDLWSSHVKQSRNHVKSVAKNKQKNQQLAEKVTSNYSPPKQMVSFWWMSLQNSLFFTL